MKKGQMEIIIDKTLIDEWVKKHPDRPIGIWGKLLGM